MKIVPILGQRPTRWDQQNLERQSFCCPKKTNQNNTGAASWLLEVLIFIWSYINSSSPLIFDFNLWIKTCVSEDPSQSTRARRNMRATTKGRQNATRLPRRNIVKLSLWVFEHTPRFHRFVGRWTPLWDIRSAQHWLALWRSTKVEQNTLYALIFIILKVQI